MDIPVFALWFVCGLGTAVFGAVAPPSGAGIAAGLTGIAAGSWWIRQPFAPSPAAVAVAVALIATLLLVRPRRLPYAAATAGLLAGIWSAVLQWQGLPAAGAIGAAATVPIASAYLSTRRPAFAPAALREEALLFLVLLGVVAAAAPGIAEGWRAALTLNVQSEAGTPAPAAMPPWTLFAASAALVSGALFSLWSRR